MVFQRPLYMQAASGDPSISYTAQLDRQVVRALVSREGVFDLDSVAPIVRQRGAGANASIDIAAFRGAVVGDDVANQGTYMIYNDATLNLTTGIPAPPASGTRRHRVVVRVRDKLHNGTWTTYDALPVILADTGSGTPAEPATAITVGFINQGVGQTSITTAMIETTTARASVGTPAITGTLSMISAYSPDSLRPPSYHVNPDGWVSLAGFVTWAGTGQTIPAGSFTDTMLSGVLPAAIRPNTFRDMTMTTNLAPVQFTAAADGSLKWRPWWAHQLVAGSSWFSLDGCGWRL